MQPVKLISPEGVAVVATCPADVVNLKARGYSEAPQPKATKPAGQKPAGK